MRSVVISGIGVISALGHNREEFWQALCAGRSGIGPIRSADCSRVRFQNGAEVPGYDAKKFEHKTPELLERFAQFAVLAAREAVADAKIAWTPSLRQRTAVVTGSCVGGRSCEDPTYFELYAQNRNRVHPLTIPRTMDSAGASQISIEFGISGPTLTVSTACASAGHAIGQAFWMVRHGMVDLALAGGSEAPFVFGHLKAWEALRVVAPDTCRPFSKDRLGMILGEGGGMLVLETRESARARGASVYAEVVGFGMSSDAFHATQTSPEGGALAMQRALEDGGLKPEQIDYINAHGTGTAVNDVAETTAIKTVFGAHAKKLAVSSTKSMHGHALGAAAGLEAAATALALARGVLPPTANFTTADPKCDLDVIPNQARPAEAGFALSNSFAFGGLNAVLAFRRCEPEPG